MKKREDESITTLVNTRGVMTAVSNEKNATHLLPFEIYKGEYVTIGNKVILKYLSISLYIVI